MDYLNMWMNRDLDELRAALRVLPTHKYKAAVRGLMRPLADFDMDAIDYDLELDALHEFLQTVRR